MKPKATPEDSFTSLRELILRIEASGNASAASELREGFSCLNGLTDGWAQFLASVDRTISLISRTDRKAELPELKRVRKLVSKIVHRK